LTDIGALLHSGIAEHSVLRLRMFPDSRIGLGGRWDVLAKRKERG
jgi:hypothetical protein